MAMTIMDMQNNNIPLLVRQKSREYYRLSRLNQVFYYATRTIAGVCSALLPFAVNVDKILATVMAIAVAVTVAVDEIFKPGDKWALYSKASDLMTLAQAKMAPDYEQHKELLEILKDTEERLVQRRPGIDDVLDRVKRYTP